MGTNLQLGTGEEDDEWSPVKMTGKQLENRAVLMASSGGQHTVLLVKDKQESWISSEVEIDEGCFMPYGGGALVTMLMSKDLVDLCCDFPLSQVSKVRFRPFYTGAILFLM